MTTQPIPNEFLTSLDDNRVRPYTSGIRPRSETIASIILLTSDENRIQPASNTQQTNKDYLEDLSGRVASLVPEASKSGNVSAPTPNGKIPLLTLDDQNDYYGIFNNFSLLKVRDGHDQIVKIHQHFGGEWNAFFFGAKPEIYTFDGFFIDSENYPYYQEFMVAYEKYLAGRKCVENKMRMKIVYDGKMVDGFMLNITTASSADTPSMKQFSFTVLVRGTNWLRTNLVPFVINSSGRIEYREGQNIMSNVSRIKSLSGESAIESLEDDSSGNIARANR